MTKLYHFIIFYLNTIRKERLMWERGENTYCFYCMYPPPYMGVDPTRKQHIQPRQREGYVVLLHLYGLNGFAIIYEHAIGVHYLKAKNNYEEPSQIIF